MNWSLVKIKEAQAIMAHGARLVGAGQLDSALTEFQEALKVFESVYMSFRNEPDVPPHIVEILYRESATALNNIGFIYLRAGHLPDALSYLQNSLRIQEGLDATSTQTAIALSNVGAVYLELGSLAMAAAFFDKALVLHRANPTDPLEMATVLGNVGGIYLKQGELARALSAFEESLELARIHSTTGLEVARDLNNIGYVHQAMGDLGRARATFHEALKIYRRNRSEFDIARIFNNLGGVYQNHGNSRKALRFFKRALKLDLVEPDSTQVATDFNNIASVYVTQGDLNRARQIFHQALRINRKAARQSPDTARTLSNLGGVYRAQGKLGKAMRFFEWAWKIDNAVAENSIGCGVRLNAIADIHQLMGDLKSALEFHYRALAIVEKAQSAIDTSLTLNSIGGIYQQQSYLNDARSFYHRGLEVARDISRQSSLVATGFTNLGSLHRQQGNLHKALRFFERALRIDERESTTSQHTARDLANMGSVHFMLENLVEARFYFHRALKVDRRISRTSLNAGRRLNNIGSVYWAQNKLPKALRFYRRALKIFGEVPLVPAATALNNIGSALWHQDEAEEALAAYEKAVSIVEQLRFKAGDDAAREGLFSGHQTPYHGVIACCLKRKAIGDDARAYEVAEFTRTRLLVDRLAARAMRAQTPEQQLVDEERALLAKVRELEVSQKAAHAPLRREKQALLTESRQRLSSIEQALREHLPAYADLNRKPISLFDTRREVVPPDTLLLSYCIAGSVVVGWAIRADSHADGVQMFMVGESPAINEAARNAIAPYDLRAEVDFCRRRLLAAVDGAAQNHYREKLAQITAELNSAQGVAADALRVLADGLWGKVRHTLKQGVQRLIVVPDGELNAVPFEILPVQGGYLGDSYSISYSPSATALSALNELWSNRPAASESRYDFLGFAPDFLWGSGDDSYAPLDGTRRQVERVKHCFDRPVALLDRDANMAKIEPLLKSVDVVLGATHGSFHSADPSSSGLVLAGGTIWSARQLMTGNTPLYIELFVASACNSGRGAYRAGEGLTGFRAALMAAGVKVAVVALWPVDDNAAALFVDAFFQEWTNSPSPSVEHSLSAGRAALKRKFIYRDPYFWAAFVAIGLTLKQGRQPDPKPEVQIPEEQTVLAQESL